MCCSYAMTCGPEGGFGKHWPSFLFEVARLSRKAPTVSSISDGLTCLLAPRHIVDICLLSTVGFLIPYQVTLPTESVAEF